MIPRVLIHRLDPNVPQAPDAEPREPELDYSWFDFHPGDPIETAIHQYLLDHINSPLSTVFVHKGHVIYLRWWHSPGYGIAIIMGAISDDIYNIGLETYAWSRYVVAYHDADPSGWNNLQEIFKESHHDESITEIPKDISREWYDIAISGGTYQVDRGSEHYHYDIANILGFFPWIIFFVDRGQVTPSHFELSVSINSDFPLDMDDIFDHIDEEMDEKFWLLIYQFVLQLESLPTENRADIWYRYLQAVHDFTSSTEKYRHKINNLFQYKDLLSIFDFGFLSTYVQKLLKNIAEEPSSPELCHLMLKFSEQLLDQDFTDLGKLTEATILEHTLQLEDSEAKLELIKELTHRSSKWGDPHLIGFIQSLTGLLSHDETGQHILSEAVDLVVETLQDTWDGILCLVESKILAGRISEAIELRFEASKQIPDKTSRAEDSFSSLVWSLKYDLPANELYELSLPFLDYAFDVLDDEVLIQQTDIVTQTAIRESRETFLHHYFDYLRSKLGTFTKGSRTVLLNNLDLILNTPRDYPHVYIEYLFLQLYSLQYQENEISDPAYDLIGQIFNKINPSDPDSDLSLRYICSKLVDFGTIVGEWPLIEETERRFLLLSTDQEKANNHLKTLFFKNALSRAKLPGSKLEHNDIGLALFNQAMQYIDLSSDYDIVKRMLPQIKKLATRSRSYHEFADLILTEVRLKKVLESDWTSSFLGDLDLLANRGNIEEINHVFKHVFTRMDLTETEREELLKAQLQLAEVEPDILSADQIYNKRLELVELGSDDPENYEMVIENYQQGISELISKADTSNLTNLLLDAIAFAQKHDAPELKEFSDLLLDNFENLKEDYNETSSLESYKYLLTLWRKVLNLFKDTDLDTVWIFSSKLVDLNFEFYDRNQQNVYLRRVQLVFKEMSLVVDQSPISLDIPQRDEILVAYDQFCEILSGSHDDFGIVDTILESARFCNTLGKPDHFLQFLDQSIDEYKHDIVRDRQAHSAIPLMFLIISEVVAERDIRPESELSQVLINRLDAILNFALSLDLSPQFRDNMRQLQQSLHQSPLSTIREIPTMMNDYLQNLSFSLLSS